MYAAHYLPRMGYAKRAHLMNSMVPGLSGGKMSASDPKSKIDFLDKPSEVKAKLKSAVCGPGEVEGNGVLAFTKTVLFPIQALRNEQAKARGEEEYKGESSFAAADAPAGTMFSITRPEKYGGSVHFPSYEALEAAYAKEDIHPGDLKGAVTDALNALLGPVQKMFEADPDWQEAEKLGYPSAADALALASAKQGAGDKSDGKASLTSGVRSRRLTFRKPRRSSETSHQQRRSGLLFEPLRKRRSSLKLKRKRSPTTSRLTNLRLGRRRLRLLRRKLPPRVAVSRRLCVERCITLPDR